MGNKADPMFRKAQLKLFTVITSILLAVFIALLGSVNIITQKVMDHQSEYVLEQIAASIEYNDRDNYFTLSRPEDYEPQKNDIWNDTWNDIWKYYPAEDTETAMTTTVTTTAASSTGSVPSSSSEGASAPSAGGDQRADQHTEQHADNNNNNKNNNTQKPTSPPSSEAATTAPKHEETTKNPYEKWWEDWAKQIPTQDPNQWQQPGGWGGNQGQQGQQGQQGWQQWQPPAYQPPTQNQEQQQQWQQWGWQQWGVPSYGKESQSKEKEDEKAEGTAYTQSEPELRGLAYNDIYGGGIVALGNAAPHTEETHTTTAPTTTSTTTTTWNMQILQDVWINGEHYDEYGRRIKPIPKSFGSVDFFAIMSDKNGIFIAALNNDDIDDEQAQGYINDILAKNVQSGMLNNFQFCCASKHNGTLMVLSDKSSVIDVLNNLKQITIMIGLISIIILAIAAFILSKKSIEPIKIAFERQKQFVSDASHELKTPLTVISTNADVLEGEIGENKWLSYIKSQTDRMNVLVNDLLSLTRLENNSSNFITTEFDLSKAIENTALPFECQAFEQNKKFIIDVDKGITIKGSEQHLKQMAAIFIDNALKYSDDGGTVKVMLKKQGEKKVFSVYNTGQGVKEEDKYKIFERFYRSDESRNRSTGGYGLGLAIAKSIIDKHKFKISVLNQEGKSICFVVSM